ncbi:hypothetical protein [Streptomyces chartreusis]|uniref:hypothetical protein n=1 Tax=Streptomyces chartreusis TaxID=1969 RepID=UPI0033B2496C
MSAESESLVTATGPAKALVVARSSEELHEGRVQVPSVDLLAQAEAPAPGTSLDADEVLAAAQRCTGR